MQALSSNAANGMKTAQRPRRDEWTTLCRGAFCERLGAGRKMRAQRFSGSLTAVTPHIMFVARKTDAPACLQVLRCGGTETYDLTLHLHLGTRSSRAQLGLRRFVFLRKPQTSDAHLGRGHPSCTHHPRELRKCMPVEKYGDFWLHLKHPNPRLAFPE